MKEINNNIEETNCSLEVSQLLKEKRFGVPCPNAYIKEVVRDGNTGGDIFTGKIKLVKNPSYFLKPRFVCYAPTHSIALEWIRVNFSIHLRVSRIYRRPLFDEPAPEPMFTVEIDDLYSKNGKAYSDGVIDNFDTPQEAIEAGLLHTLTNLIS